jgi:hypothetical protein
MQGQPFTGGQAVQGPSGKAGPGTTLAAIALAIAVVAVALNFVVPGPTGARGAQGGTGSTGSPGSTGPTGSQGPPVTEFWADVNVSGALVHGSQSNGSFLLSTGNYQVNFTQNVSQCGFVGSVVVQSSIGVPPAGGVTVAARNQDPDALWVTTNGPTGVPTDEAFDVVAVCSADLWAVVGPTGSVVRGVDVVSAAHDGTGGYTVVFDQDVANCAFLGTLGTVGSSGLVSPGYVSVQGEYETPNGVYVATYNATGVATDSSFHLAVVCNSPDWAVVSTAGGLVRGSSTGASGSGGAYRVTFSQDVMNCAYVATAGGTGSQFIYGPASVAMAGEAGNQDGVYLQTYNDTGVTTAESFHLGVFC